MNSYRGTRTLTSVAGWQTFGCQAETPEEAVEILNSGEGVYVCQEIDIMNSTDVVLEELEEGEYTEDEDNLMPGLEKKLRAMKECLELIVDQGGTDVVINNVVENCAALCLEEVSQ